MIRLLAALFLLLALGASAQPLALPSPPQAGLVQRPGALLPLDALLRDDLGQPVRLGDYFHPGQPVLLVPAYYRCTELCGLLMQGLLQGLQQSGLPRSDWRIVVFSIAPGDQPADAHRRRDLDLAYASFLEGARGTDTLLHLDVLVADGAQSSRIAQAIGLRYQAQPPSSGGAAGEIAHPATVIVATPAGMVARYLNGVQFTPEELRSALAEAGQGRIGGLGERLAVLCAHFAPSVGRHSAAVLDAARVAGLLTLAGLVAIAWRHQVRGRR
ncbi:hypothetical protein [Ramlibacter sp.]|uniref:hypothetical protein n=1 Tax=Ramlibacter sp. TaxID=1917967 RepID=UPI002617B738|nr:hypothetical protein [Ramlibacter sp.]MDB5958530.1 hypothetical protein [Ramlibacter sp.]